MLHEAPGGLKSCEASGGINEPPCLVLAEAAAFRTGANGAGHQGRDDLRRVCRGERDGRKTKVQHEFDRPPSSPPTLLTYDLPFARLGITPNFRSKFALRSGKCGLKLSSSCSTIAKITHHAQAYNPLKVSESPLHQGYTI
ncbi:hypothetical protein K443DRAFT_408243 [Laccaria amethystina LaAM-08-1]|uniref:Unplaced genomic scaffold K443scaffold_324, whole genome shotgun sequence n=1 Tax=Laccaria amethystina LaAM-08-1 TaxID=1095629 RepID=A0A0C9X6B2_9AGAR|nr:hypothetical protein K443DRAFT_408243 [Laccaria amethystina LaAM-08-1]